MIGCSLGDDGVATEGDSCSFSCDGTYVLRGSSSRACQNDGTWDGTEADCLSELYMWDKLTPQHDSLQYYLALCIHIQLHA